MADQTLDNDGVSINPKKVESLVHRTKIGSTVLLPPKLELYRISSSSSSDGALTAAVSGPDIMADGSYKGSRGLVLNMQMPSTPEGRYLISVTPVVAPTEPGTQGYFADAISPNGQHVAGMGWGTRNGDSFYYGLRWDLNQPLNLPETSPFPNSNFFAVSNSGLALGEAGTRSFLADKKGRHFEFPPVTSPDYTNVSSYRPSMFNITPDSKLISGAGFFDHLLGNGTLLGYMPVIFEKQGGDELSYKGSSLSPAGISLDILDGFKVIPGFRRAIGEQLSVFPTASRSGGIREPDIVVTEARLGGYANPLAVHRVNIYQRSPGEEQWRRTNTNAANDQEGSNTIRLFTGAEYVGDNVITGSMERYSQPRRDPNTGGIRVINNERVGAIYPLQAPLGSRVPVPIDANDLLGNQFGKQESLIPPNIISIQSVLHLFHKPDGTTNITWTGYDTSNSNRIGVTALPTTEYLKRLTRLSAESQERE